MLVNQRRSMIASAAMLGGAVAVGVLLAVAPTHGWLQSVDEPNLAFVVTDPTIFFKEYQVPLREETWQDLQLADEGDVQCFVICNKVGEWLTGNLLGPIVVNSANRLAQQVVLTEKKWTTRQPLMALQTESAPLAKAATAAMSKPVGDVSQP